MRERECSASDYKEDGPVIFLKLLPGLVVSIVLASQNELGIFPLLFSE